MPATGKTTVARALARRLRAAYLRVDTIEAAIVEHSELAHPVGVVGYAVGYRLAADQLQLGLDVVAESVNPLGITRDAWLAVATEAGAGAMEIEIICSDRAEHRRRVEHRTLDIDGLVPPTWEEIENRDYRPWDRDPLVLDTAVLTPTAAVQRVLQTLSRRRAG
nr:AAA family ATPase [Microlunatus panaciterrae]